MKLTKKKIAILTAPLFEDLELWYPYYRMKEEGADIEFIGASKKTYTGKNGLTATVKTDINEALPKDYDAVIIPGGYSPDHMRRTQKMIDFVKEMNDDKKPVAAICHGPWMAISAGAVKGRKVTGYYSIKDDIVNAGGEYLDVPVSYDDNLITSRTPDDLPEFCKTIIKALSD